MIDVRSAGGWGGGGRGRGEVWQWFPETEGYVECSGGQGSKQHFLLCVV